METRPRPRRHRSPSPDDFTRTGAVWVTATGATLLVVAAAVFVAVRWDQIPDALKLAVLGGLSGAALLAGRKLRRRLPATAVVLYHLGAFLVPVVSAAVALRFEPSWGALLLVEGTTGAVVLFGLERVERSLVLRVAAAIAVVVAALGLGATAGVAPTLTIAGAAVVAEAIRASRLARAWALTAGLAPVVGLAAPVLASPTLLDDLAITSSDVRPEVLVAALLAATVLYLEARARRELAVLVAAGASLALGVATTWLDARPPADLAWLAAAAGFLGAELAAWLLRRDEFLRRPARVLAGAAEVAAAVVALPWAAVVLVAPGPAVQLWATAGTASVVVAAVTAASAWVLADTRRREPDHTPSGIALLVGSGWAPATFGFCATAIAGVAFGSGSLPAVSVTTTALAVVLVVSGRAWAHPLAAWFAIAAVVAALDHPALAVATALVGAIALAAAAVLRARGISSTTRTTRTAPVGPMSEPDVVVGTTWSLAGLAPVPLAVALVATSGAVDERAWLLGWIAACWLVALVLDRASAIELTRHLGLVGRGAMLAIVPAAIATGAAETALATSFVAVLCAADALRRKVVEDAFVAALAVPIVVATAPFALDGDAELAAVSLGTCALTSAGLAAVVRARWRRPFFVTASAAAALALPLGATDAEAFATVLLLLGATVLVVAVELRSALAGVAGAAISCVGVWAHLDAADVVATDAYVAPVAVALLVAGVIAKRRNGIGSWTAYGPALTLLGAASLAERFAGGPPIHALVAGTIGTVAVMVGGWRRLAAPLVLGTAMLGSVVVSETLTFSATLPTWAWLAASGTALVAAGVAMERAEVGPLETGRRMVDVVRDRFA